jgi:hypothetical protein
LERLAAEFLASVILADAGMQVTDYVRHTVEKRYPG